MPPTHMVRRYLGSRLREQRLAAHKTALDVAQASFSRSTLHRIEHGQTSIRPGAVWDLCQLYQTSEAEAHLYISLARFTTESAHWWGHFGSLIRDWPGLHFDLEGQASSLRTWDAERFHPLLQVPDYQCAVSAACGQRPDVEDIPRGALHANRVAAFLDRVPVTQLAMVVGEGALRRLVGSYEIMASQLAHLVRVIDTGQVSVRVLRFDAGAHPALGGGAFTIMSMRDEEDPDIVHLESRIGAQYLERPQELAEYEGVWETLRDLSVPLKDFLREYPAI